VSLDLVYTGPLNMHRYRDFPFALAGLWSLVSFVVKIFVLYTRLFGYVVGLINKVSRRQPG